MERIVDVLPITAAGVTLISPGTDPHYVAASDDSALRFERLQTELADGPCLVAYRTGNAVAAADLHGESRFPHFAPRALEEGLRAVFAFPMRHGDERLGALDLYRDTPGELDDDAMSAAQTLADVAAAYLLNAEARGQLRARPPRDCVHCASRCAHGVTESDLLLERLDHAVLRARRSGTWQRSCSRISTASSW